MGAQQEVIKLVSAVASSIESTFMIKTKTKEIWQVHLWQKTIASIMANTFMPKIKTSTWQVLL